MNKMLGVRRTVEGAVHVITGSELEQMLNTWPCAWRAFAWRYGNVVHPVCSCQLQCTK